ncbi:MAG: hypothetical protein CMH27_03650 [Micavibrio sp.]|nr:hypothetical protein [Micavibrio sp.]|tara:strand:+ start:6035 stop:6541 length:507 start_codon:yes stop_codon:yes gene_type:complete
MVYDGREIANFILDFCDKKNVRVSNLALQKILYFCHVWSLVKLDQPLIRHQFEAWQFGPVLQYVYREFKDFEKQPITSRAYKLDAQTGQKYKAAYCLDSPTQELLENVVGFYSRLPASYLVDLSHAKGGPWDIVYNHTEKVRPGMKIDNACIRQYYSEANDDYRRFVC